MDCGPERAYEALRSEGLRGGHQLRLASQILCSGSPEPGGATQRFHALHSEFQAAGLSVRSRDLAAVAFLTRLNQEPSVTAAVHRRILGQLDEARRPRTGKEARFAIAAALLMAEIFVAAPDQPQGRPEAGPDPSDSLTLIQAHRSAVMDLAAAPC